MADIDARSPDEAELMRKKKWRFKKKEMALFKETMIPY